MTAMQGRVVLITGGASGIGAACVERFATAGAIAVATDIQKQQGTALIERIESTGGTGLFLEQDVSSEAAWNEVSAHIIERYGRLDCLVNNAGIGSPGRIADFSLEQWRNLFAINVEGVFLGTKYCIPHLAAEGGGAIVNISSVAGLQGAQGLSAYCATKGAVRLFTKAVARECAADGLKVRCNSIHPGIIDTPIWDHIFESDEVSDAQSNERTPQAVAAVAVPGGHVGTPQQVADAVLFLGSDASSYINGAELAVDYGLSC